MRKAREAVLKTELGKLERYPASTKRCTGGKKLVGRRAHIPGDQQQPNQVLFNNDPSAGSPTETLLRLLLPLNDQV